MRRLVFVAALALAGCDGGAQTTADGYTFGPPEFEREAVAVTIVQYDSHADFLIAARHHRAELRGLQAFSLLGRTEATCEIHIERIASDYRPQWLGHEMAHCIHGRWHP